MRRDKWFKSLIFNCLFLRRVGESTIGLWVIAQAHPQQNVGDSTSPSTGVGDSTTSRAGGCVGKRGRFRKRNLKHAKECSIQQRRGFACGVCRWKRRFGCSRNSAVSAARFESGFRERDGQGQHWRGLSFLEGDCTECQESAARPVGAIFCGSVPCAEQRQAMPLNRRCRMRRPCASLGHTTP